MNKMNLCKHKNRVLILTSLAVLASPLVLPLEQAFAQTLTTVVNFNGTNGAAPRAGVLPGSDGNLYGTTSAGGSQSQGAIYRLTGGTITSLFSFNGTNGATPESTLIQLANAFYGTASAGGASGQGTVFKFTP